MCFPSRLGADCSGSNPAQNLLREELNSSLELAEKLARQYDELLRSYQQKMLNTSALLKQLNEQFNWVSQLANLTQREDQYSLQVTTVSLSDSWDPRCGPERMRWASLGVKRDEDLCFPLSVCPAGGNI